MKSALILTLALFALSLPLQQSFAETPSTVDTSEPSVNGVYRVSGNWETFKRSWNNLSITVIDANLQPVDGATITLAYDMVGMTMNPPVEPIVAKGNGVYETRVFLGMRGKYKFDFTIDKDGKQDTYSTTQMAK